MSPLRMLIRPVVGVWHACPGALLFAGDIDVTVRVEVPSPCGSSGGRPYLSACPIAAFAADTYNVAGCLGHLDGPDDEYCVALTAGGERVPICAGAGAFPHGRFPACHPPVLRYRCGCNEDGELGRHRVPAAFQGGTKPSAPMVRPRMVPGSVPRSGILGMAPFVFLRLQADFPRPETTTAEGGERRLRSMPGSFGRLLKRTIRRHGTKPEPPTGVGRERNGWFEAEQRWNDTFEINMVSWRDAK